MTFAHPQSWGLSAWHLIDKDPKSNYVIFKSLRKAQRFVRFHLPGVLKELQGLQLTVRGENSWCTSWNHLFAIDWLVDWHIMDSKLNVFAVWCRLPYSLLPDVTSKASSPSKPSLQRCHRARRLPHILTIWHSAGPQWRNWLLHCHKCFVADQQNRWLVSSCWNISDFRELRVSGC